MYDDEEDNDEDGNDEDGNARSVILFNTWSRQGPRGVLPDYMTGTLPGGIEIDDDDNSVDYHEQQQAQRVAEWEADYGVNCEDLWCQDSTTWKRLFIGDYKNVEPSQNTTALRVSLMGNRKRRKHPDKYISLSGPPNLGAALEEASQPAAFQLQEMTESY